MKNLSCLIATLLLKHLSVFKIIIKLIIHILYLNKICESFIASLTIILLMHMFYVGQ